MAGLAVGERAVAPGLVPYAGHEGSRQDVYPGTIQRGRQPGHYNQQRRAGPMDTDLNPASADWAVPQKAATALNRRAR
jgi:3-oxoacyl-[acyl-carrier protein] reductase